MANNLEGKQIQNRPGEGWSLAGNSAYMSNNPPTIKPGCRICLFFNCSYSCNLDSNAGATENLASLR